MAAMLSLGGIPSFSGAVLPGAGCKKGGARLILDEFPVATGSVGKEDRVCL